MKFGKPRLSTQTVRCIDCGEKYPEKEIELEHAGRIEVNDATGSVEPGDYWNSRCPKCGGINSMQEEYAEMSDEEFKEKQHEVARLLHEMRKETRQK